MDTIIGLKELRENVAAYAQQVSQGKTFVVVRRSKPIFRITQPLQMVDPDIDAQGYVTLVDLKKVRKSGVLAQDAIAALRQHGETPKANK